MIVGAKGKSLSGMKVLSSGLSFLNRRNAGRVPWRTLLVGVLFWDGGRVGSDGGPECLRAMRGGSCRGLAGSEFAGAAIFDLEVLPVSGLSDD